MSQQLRTCCATKNLSAPHHALAWCGAVLLYLPRWGKGVWGRGVGRVGSRLKPPGSPPPGSPPTCPVLGPDTCHAPLRTPPNMPWGTPLGVSRNFKGAPCKTQTDFTCSHFGGELLEILLSMAPGSCLPFREYNQLRKISHELVRSASVRAEKLSQNEVDAKLISPLAQFM